MSASQLTPRATSAALLPEKSLPRPPPLPSSVASTSYATNTLKALPARPAFGRSVTEAESKSRRLPKTSLWFSETNDSTAGSSLSIDSETPKRSLFAPSAACATTTMASPPHQHQPNDSFIPVHPHTISRQGANVFPTEREGSLLLTPEDSQTAQQQMPHTSTMPSKVRSSSARRQPRPSLPSHWRGSGDTYKDAQPMPPRQSSVDAISSAFPLQASQQDHSAESSPESRALSWQSTPFSSDHSLRCSSSTQTSLWTDKTLPSCSTSPLCASFGPASDEMDKDADSAATGAGENTEELDENSVGLGITSDLGMDVSSRRSSAVPVMPSPMLPGSAKALQGPFSHHRAPSWTRRMDSAPFAGLSSLHQSGEMVDTFGASAHAGLRSLGLNVMPSMQRALSDVTPVSAANEDVAAAVAASSTLSNPAIPVRRDSRSRCASDAVTYLPTGANSTPHSRSPSLSVSSPTSSLATSSRLASTSGMVANSDPSGMQSPPRTSSLRQSPSMGSLRSSPLKDGSPRNSPYRPPVLASMRPPRPTLERIATIDDLNMTIDDLNNSVSALQQASEAVPKRDSPSRTSLRTSSAASRARRVSDVSISSFLQNGEFGHIVGAYTSKMRWEEGLYDFDESIETDGDESRAVKTAEDGSATIVEGHNLSLAQIEAETGPNTTHLLLSGNQTEGLVEVLERALPLATNLLVLDLSRCALQHLPDAIGACVALEELDISGNPVGDLPDWILNLRALRTFSLDSTGLHYLPSSLIQLQELQRLSLRNNELIILPSWLHRMSKLNYLFVEGNQFRGPWQSIVAPLLSPSQQTAMLNASPASRQATLAKQQTPARPFMARMRSANDLQNMLRGHFGAQTPPVSTPDSQNDDSGYVSARGIDTPPTAGYENPLADQSYDEDPERRLSSGGKWGGFLKKIGRKASSHKLNSADQEMSYAESRFSSPRASRKSLRSSSRAVRSSSSSENSVAPPMLPPQSEPVPTAVALASKSLAAATVDDSSSDHVAAVLNSSSGLAAPAGSASLLQPYSSDAAAVKKNRRRTFLPMHAFAAPAATVALRSHEAGHPASSISAQEEMDEESLAQHRGRLRALMHYLRDLDDLTAARSEAASFVGPSKSNLAQLREAGGHSRTPSMHRAESSNPSTRSRDSSGDYVASTAASSVSENAASDSARLSTAQCTKDDSVRRFRIIAEIVSTERTYVKGLSELVDIYVKPAMAPADGHSGVPVIPPTEHRAVFGNVEALLRFHRTVFLPSLIATASPVLEHDQDSPFEMAAEETTAVAEKVASVFTKHAAFFKMYSSYINNCDSAQERLAAWMAPSSAGNVGGLTLRGAPGYSALQALGTMSLNHGAAAAAFAHGSTNSMSGNDGGLTPSQRKKVKTFMKRCRTHPRHTQLNVEGYLLLPVQRIPRYRLLLEDLVKSTDTARLADAYALATALENVTQIASKVNESKRQSEQDRRLLAWQYRIKGSIGEPLVQPHRRLLKDGTLQLKRVVRRVPGFIRSNRSASVSSAHQQEGNRALSTLDAGSQNHLLSADHLQQVTLDQSMAMVLCSDVAVLCTEQTRSKDPSAPVLLRSMLKLVRPVEILGGVTLRVVDGSEILYLAASSAEDAVAWKTAFDLHFYQ